MGNVCKDNKEKNEKELIELARISKREIIQFNDIKELENSEEKKEINIEQKIEGNWLKNNNFVLKKHLKLCNF